MGVRVDPSDLPDHLKVPDDDLPDHLRPQGAISEPPSFGSELASGLGGMATGFVKGLNPMNLVNAAIHPYDTFVQPSINEFNKATTKWQSGNKLEGAVDMLGAVPVVGPAISGIAESAANDSPEQFGETLGNVLGQTVGAKYTPRAVGKVAGTLAAPVARRIPGTAAAEELATAKKTKAVQHLAKASDIPSKDPYILRNLEGSIEHVHDLAVKKGLDLNKVGMEKYRDLAKEAADTYWNDNVKSVVAKYGKESVDTSSLAGKMVEHLDDITREQNPSAAKAAEADAGTYLKPKTIDQIEKRIETLNKELDTYSKANMVKQAELKGSPSVGHKISELEGLRDILADELGKRTGQDFRQIKRVYGSIADTRDAFNEALIKQKNTLAKEKGERFPKAMELGRVVKDAASLNLGSAAGRVGRSIARHVGAKGLAEAQTPDRLVASAMKEMGGRSRLPKAKPQTQKPAIAPPPTTAPQQQPPVAQASISVQKQYAPIKPKAVGSEAEALADINNVVQKTQQAQKKTPVQQAVANKTFQRPAPSSLSENFHQAIKLATIDPDIDAAGLQKHLNIGPAEASQLFDHLNRIGLTYKRAPKQIKEPSLPAAQKPSPKTPTLPPPPETASPSKASASVKEPAPAMKKTQPATQDYQSMRPSELVALAHKLGINLPPKLNHQILVDLITKHQQQK